MAIYLLLTRESHVFAGGNLQVETFLTEVTGITDARRGVTTNENF